MIFIVGPNTFLARASHLVRFVTLEMASRQQLSKRIVKHQGGSDG